MKKILSLSFLLSAILIFSQSNRFFYEYKFISDSTDKADIKKEIMLLDIDKNGSNYYSQDKFVSDSTSKADLEKQLKLSPNNININRREKPGQISYKVRKQYPDFKTYLFTRISSDSYKIEEDQKPEWKILQNKQKIGAYNTQKATTNFGGREWTAWFSTDLPFQDGPYKFYGLPGLIVKIEDKTGSHSMTLVGNKMIAIAAEKETELPQGVQIYGMGGKDIEINKNQFKKAWKSYVNDPTKNMREMMMKNTETNRVVFKTTSANGKEISDPNQVFREMEKKAKEGFKKNNNPIEPDLYK
ncbi:GLPGLI family protein [Chryseobacterium wangxinyae]|uniref:GLPGLI family protein n=1 Tax=Chryseobacterium sp. CY350 TaxID=2997336 RepID=UPI00226FB85F|nr:GLPGLI family protein [Chryseobacterium sp. CY350]MCY0978636.1 GLPGLI family protein [Chryseobacterium sp. CY350]WBZ96405.1 GLPGLI family protein [Chryseobacterium sp. CY350]